MAKVIWVIAGIFVAWCVLMISLLPPAKVWWAVGAIICFTVAAVSLIRRRRDTQLARRLGANWWIPVLAVTATCLTTLFIQWSLDGYRDVPWTFFYVVQFLVWMAVLFIQLCLFREGFWNTFQERFKTWIQVGGFWKIWSQHNSPANSFLTLYLLYSFMAILYGPPTPAIHLDELGQKAQSVWSDVSSSPAARQLAKVVNFGSALLVGQELIDTGPKDPPVAETLLPRFERGWWHLVPIFVLFPPALFGMLMSRRDGVVKLLERLLGWFKSKKQSHSGSATAQAGGGGGGQSMFGKLLFTDIIAEVITEVLGGMIKFFRTKNN